MMATPQEAVRRTAEKQKAYQITFANGGPAADAFTDLARYCHAFHNEVIAGDHDTTLRMAGRREAYFHIWQLLHLTPEEFIAIAPKVLIGDKA